MNTSAILTAVASAGCIFAAWQNLRAYRKARGVLREYSAKLAEVNELLEPATSMSDALSWFILQAILSNLSPLGRVNLYHMLLTMNWDLDEDEDESEDSNHE